MNPNRLLSIFGFLVGFQSNNISASKKRWCGEYICLPANYSSTQRPCDNMTVYFQLNEQDDLLFTTLSRVNDKEFTLSLTLALLVFWYDPRLEFVNLNNTPDFFGLESYWNDQIWVPDATIGPLKSMTVLESLQGKPFGTGFEISCLK